MINAPDSKVKTSRPKKSKISKKTSAEKKVWDKESESYKRHREKMATKRQEISLAGREIGDIPKIKNPARRRKTLRSFKAFCETYFPKTFYLEWSPAHLTIIQKIETAVLKGGLFAMAIPRGGGKSSLCECACIWGILIGKHKFICLIGSDASHAEDILESIKVELETNEMLLEDFPEALYPVSKLDRISQRQKGQLYKGKPTRIKWVADELVFPYIPRSKAAGACIRSAGLGASIRGMKRKLPNGATIRPTLVVLDDPQTDESARSPSQNITRLQLLNGAVLGLAGPGKKISGFMPCTVIQQNDMADQILDRKKNPEWQGERVKMVNAFPKNEELWEQYAKIRNASLETDGDGSEATDFYRENRVAMDVGAKVTWKARYNEDELSAVQHAMNLLLRNEWSFYSEYQNDPKPPPSEIDDDDEALAPEKLATKCTRMRKGMVPQNANTLTMFIDSQLRVLYWIVVAWESNFNGSIISYGTYPQQTKRVFLGREVKQTLQKQFPGCGVEQATYKGLGVLEHEIIGKDWQREDGELLKISRCLIDANYSKTTDVIYQFCKSSPLSAILLPSHGRFIGASTPSFAEYSKKPGDHIGYNWRIPAKSSTKRLSRHVLFDANFWKSFITERLNTEIGGNGCLTIYGKPESHLLLFDQLCSEYRVTTQRLTGKSRTVDEWKLKPDKTEDHWRDGVVGCAVAASMCGLRLPEHSRPFKATAKKRVSLSKLQEKRRAERKVRETAQDEAKRPKSDKGTATPEGAPAPEAATDGSELVGGTIVQTRRKRVSLSELQRQRREERMRRGKG